MLSSDGLTLSSEEEVIIVLCAGPDLAKIITSRNERPIALGDRSCCQYTTLHTTVLSYSIALRNSTSGHHVSLPSRPPLRATTAGGTVEPELQYSARRPYQSPNRGHNYAGSNPRSADKVCYLPLLISSPCPTQAFAPPCPAREEQ